MKLFSLAWLCVFLTSLAAPVAAQELKATPKALDPARAYILVTMPDMSRWAPHSTLVISRYDPVAKDIRGRGKASGNPVATGETLDAYVSSKTFVAREGLHRVHLIGLTPGDYTFEGGVLSTGAYSTSFALGSYWFTLKPGVVTDLGVVEVKQDYAEGASLQQEALKTAFLPFRAMKLPPFILPITENKVPPPLVVGLPYEKVALKPGATFGNHLGGLLNKIDKDR